MKSVILLLVYILLLVRGEETSFVKGNRHFAASVYAELLKNGEENILVSPFSARVILALAQSGAKGDTAEELKTALNLSDEETPPIKDVIYNLQKDRAYILQIANKMYIKKNVSLKSDFKRKALDNYNSNIVNIDFSNSQSAANEINKWVELNTKHKIKNLVDPDALSPTSVAVLINALYFKAKWNTVFPEYDTKKIDFHKNNNDVVQVDAMQHARLKETFKYKDSSKLDAQILELPLEGDDAAMVLVLPNQIGGITELEQQIAQVFEEKPSKEEYVEVVLPKFMLTTTTDFNQVLQDLGVCKVFCEQEADLSGIAGDKGEVYISNIIQKAFINVTEFGIEAAATTIIGVSPSSLPPSPRQHFIADHPFLFYIKVKNVILFVGKVSNPTCT